MIALLKGTIYYKSPQYLIVNVNGVGYQVSTSIHSFSDLPENGEVELYIYTCVREDSITLYGFTSVTEKELFTLLISVSGVGPKMALSCLSIGSARLFDALVSEDTKTLATIPGVGLKTAKRLSLELKEKLDKFDKIRPSPPSAASPCTADDVISALVNLGYENRLAKMITSAIDFRNKTLEDGIKEAFRLLQDKKPVT